MELIVNTDDYLTEDEKKELVKYAFINACKHRLDSASEIQRILTNSCYHFVFDELDKIVPHYKEIMVAKVEKLITDSTLHYETFYRKMDNYGTSSAAIEIIDETVRQNREVIRKKVKDGIENYDVEKLITELFGKAWEETMDKFSGIADMMYSMMKKNQ